MSPTENDDGLKQQREAWLANRDLYLLAKSNARETHGAHFLLSPSVFDPECLDEPLRAVAMRALEYPEDLITDGADVQRTFTDFSREHLPHRVDVEGVEFSL